METTSLGNDFPGTNAPIEQDSMAYQYCRLNLPAIHERLDAPPSCTTALWGLAAAISIAYSADIPRRFWSMSQFPIE